MPLTIAHRGSPEQGEGIDAGDRMMATIRSNRRKIGDVPSDVAIAVLWRVKGDPNLKLHVALLEPEIPPNTGNISRLCAATGCPLHLIGRLGFQIDDKQLRRAGLDYWPHVELYQHATLADFEAKHPRIFCLSARADRPYTEIDIQPGDALLFGCESRGLPAEVLDRYHDRSFVIPMPAGKVRSLNLSTAVGIVVYDGLRRLQTW